MILFAESSNPKVQDYKYNGKELDLMHGLNQYDYSARQYDPARIQFTTVDPLAEKYYSISPYAYVMNNPMRFIDPTGMFLYEKIGIENNTHYGIISVLPTNYEKNAAMKHEYNTAKGENIPILLVNNIQDFADGMQENGISASSYVINSHGSEGYIQIGMQSTTSFDNFSSLKEGLNDKNVFLGSCAMTRGGDEQGKKYIEVFSTGTNSTVVSSDHSVLSGYKFDGSHYLSRPQGELTRNKKSNRSYHIATPNQSASQIFDFTIDKSGKFSWSVTLDLTTHPK